MAKMPTRSHRVMIAGHLWRLIYTSMRRRNLCGLCDYETKTISICTSMQGIDELDTLIHECLHACQGFASEDHVAEVATTLATVLWQLGYRKEAPNAKRS